MDPYEVLGVSHSASDDDIKTAYKELVKKYHPDKYQDNPLSDLAEEKLQEVNEAYDMLMKGRSTGSSGGGSAPLSEIRRAIDRGDLDGAEAMLAREPEQNAEWMFLSGMIAYKRGWYDDATGKIQRAVAMDPTNQEYRMALNSIAGAGSVYRQNAYAQGYRSNEDAFCRALQCYCCADMCCDCI